MASNEVFDTEDLVAKLEEAKELLSETRIRQIVREELDEWMKRMSQAVRANNGNTVFIKDSMGRPMIMPLSMETK